MRIVLDMDDVLASWNDRVLQWWNEDGGQATREDITDWNYWFTDTTRKYFVRGIMRHPSFYRDLDPIPGAIDGVRALLADGHEVVIATAVPKAATDAYTGKVEWVRRHMPFFRLENLIAIQRKELLSGDLLFDDGPHNLRAWAALGRYAIAMDAPWNRDIDNYRVRNWSEFLDLVAKLEGTNG